MIESIELVSGPNKSNLWYICEEVCVWFSTGTEEGGHHLELLGLRTRSETPWQQKELYSWCRGGALAVGIF